MTTSTVQPQPMKYRIFTYSGDALPIAHKLQQEGCEVVVGMVHDKAATHSAKEGEPETGKCRGQASPTGIV